MVQTQEHTSTYKIAIWAIFWVKIIPKITKCKMLLRDSDLKWPTILPMSTQESNWGELGDGIKQQWGEFCSWTMQYPIFNIFGHFLAIIRPKTPINYLFNNLKWPTRLTLGTQIPIQVIWVWQNKYKTPFTYKNSHLAHFRAILAKTGP